MDFGNTPASRLTERILGEIRLHLKQDSPPQENHHYNRVFEVVHRHLLAALLVGGLARNSGARPLAVDPRQLDGNLRDWVKATLDVFLAPLGVEASKESIDTLTQVVECRAQQLAQGGQR